ncbi:sulfate ABC transporter permease subunit CysW [Intestinibaculum porci]|uniref:Sulfate ABC transporter permease subunit CysW n=1 Tax=Intestinibaculum porci TaxID=2487118 RepID=A0A3G9JRW3_9FIRM|nr:sulfate ABC transporter permease subunit [Intestinibaculum porci]BBH27753.1 sulfate ABC transporter permease subunit CysW [Intestinibaculum porci]
MKKSKTAKILILITYLFVFFMLILPLLYCLGTAFSKGWKTFSQAVFTTYAIDAIVLTLVVSVICVLVNTLFGLLASNLLTRYQFKGKRVISALIDLPLTISPVVGGLVYVLTYGRQSILYSLLEKLNLEVMFAPLGIVLVTIFVTFPFVSREIIPVLNTRGTDEEEAAALMGASAWTIFKKITYPQVKGLLLYGIVLTMARAMGEFGAVSIISGHLLGKTMTMPLYIEFLYQGYDFVGAFALSSVLVFMALIMLFFRQLIALRKGDL